MYPLKVIESPQSNQSRCHSADSKSSKKVIESPQFNQCHSANAKSSKKVIESPQSNQLRCHSADAKSSKKVIDSPQFNQCHSANAKSSKKVIESIYSYNLPWSSCNFSILLEILATLSPNSSASFLSACSIAILFDTTVNTSGITVGAVVAAAGVATMVFIISPKSAKNICRSGACGAAAGLGYQQWSSSFHQSQQTYSYGYLSRECLLLKCLPKPSFADMSCVAATCRRHVFGHVADTRKCRVG